MSDANWCPMCLGNGKVMPEGIAAYDAPERAILQDLIAELREVPYKSREVLASQAERRLREVQGE